MHDVYISIASRVEVLLLYYDISDEGGCVGVHVGVCVCGGVCVGVCVCGCACMCVCVAISVSVMEVQEGI